MIHEQTYLGEVTLIVSNLERSLQFYSEVLGMQSMTAQKREAILYSDKDTPLLHLKEDNKAEPVVPNTYLGLYHFALLYPDRQSLGAHLTKLLKMKIPIGGADHSVSEAIYLNDPDGNGIELYSDRPRTEWSYDQDHHIYMDTKALDIESLLLDASDWNGLPSGVKMGHIHLHVNDLNTIEHFYKNVLGFSVMTYFGEQALFMAGGGYHHHFGFNTWARNDVHQAKPAVGLESFTINIPDKSTFEQVKKRLEQNQYQLLDQTADSVSLKDPSFNYIKIQKVN